MQAPHPNLPFQGKGGSVRGFLPSVIDARVCGRMVLLPPTTTAQPPVVIRQLYLVTHSDDSLKLGPFFTLFMPAAS